MKEISLTEATCLALESKLLETDVKDTFKVQPKLNIDNSRKILDCIDKAIDDLEPIWEMQSGNYFGDLVLNIGDDFNDKGDLVVDNLYDMREYIEKILKNLESEAIKK